MGSKPYIASGKYIHRMSNYCEGCRYKPAEAVGGKACPFTTLYWDFLQRHEEMLKGNQRMRMQLRNLARIDAKKKEAITRASRRSSSCYAEGRLLATRRPVAGTEREHARPLRTSARPRAVAGPSRATRVFVATNASTGSPPKRSLSACGKTARDIESAREWREGGQHHAGAIHQEDGQLLRSARRIANRQAGMQMAHNQRAEVLGPGAASKPIAMHRRDQPVRPRFHDFDGEMAEFSAKGPIVIAAHGDQGGAPTEFDQRYFQSTRAPGHTGAAHAPDRPERRFAPARDRSKSANSFSRVRKSANGPSSPRLAAPSCSQDEHPPQSPYGNRPAKARPTGARDSLEATEQRKANSIFARECLAR